MIDLARKSKLLWRARRGMLELDLILESFIQGELCLLSENEIRELEDLLKLPDPLLLSYLLGHSMPSNSAERNIIERIKHYHSAG